MEKKLLFGTTGSLSKTLTLTKDAKILTHSSKDIKQPPPTAEIAKKTLKNKSTEELLEEVNIFAVERVHLDRVFELLSQQTPNKSEEDKMYITKYDIMHILSENKLDYKMLPSEIDLMIWVSFLLFNDTTL